MGLSPPWRTMMPKTINFSVVSFEKTHFTGAVGVEVRVRQILFMFLRVYSLK
jgi:hypothetical protein